MSLINDALKRASQSQKTKPGEPVGAPLQHVESKPPSSRPWILPAACVVLFLFSSWLLWQWWTLKKNAKPQTVAVNKATINNAAKAPATTVETKSPTTIQINTNLVTRPNPGTTKPLVANPGNIRSNPATENIAVTTKSTLPPTSTSIEPSKAGPLAVSPGSNTDSQKAPVSTVEVVKSTPPPEPAAKAPGPFPELKLQGIFFRLNKPTVLINGRNLTVGDEIAGARIVQIDRQSVTVDYYGQKKVLGIQ